MTAPRAGAGAPKDSAEVDTSIAPTTAPSTNIDGALRWARRGRPVFPCDARKRPLTAHGFRDATTDEDQVRAWWARHPQALIGMPTGKASGVTILDVDVPAGPGSLLGLEVEHGDMPETFTVSTMSGGRHLYFRAWPGSKSSAGKLGDGLDVRGEGGYVIVPPSPGYAIERNLRPAEAPAWLRELATAEMTPTTTAPIDTDAPEFTSMPPEMQQAAQAYVDTAVNGIVDELRATASWPEEHTDEHGRGWEKTQADAAYRLAELASAAWTPLSIEDAHAAFVEAAPTDSGWTPRDVETKWASQVRRATPAAMPEDLGSRGSIFDGVPASPKTPPARPDRRESLTDADLAARVCDDLLRATFRWTPELGWLHFDGKRWADSSDVAVTEEVRRYLVDWHSREAKAGADMRRLEALNRLLAANRIRAIVGLTRGILKASATEFDSHPDLLNAPNGIVNLRTGELLPHDPTLLLRKMAGADYAPGARHEAWDRALRAMPDDVRPWMQVRMGQAATGHTPGDDRLLLLQGGGENGKTSILEAAQRALGDYARGISERVLTAPPNAHPTELMDLMGTRLAIIEELPDTERLPMDRIKRIVGKPTVTARYTGQNTVEFVASHTLFVTTNSLPTVTEGDHGSWRRLLLTRFPYRFRKPGEPIEGPDDRRGDPNLRPTIARSPEVHRAVLAWIVDGARQWYAAGEVLPTPPPSIEADMLAWRRQADLILAFLTDVMVPDRESAVLAQELLGAFNDYLLDRGHRAWVDKKFAGRFEAHQSVKAARIGKVRKRGTEGLSPRDPVVGVPVSTNARQAWTGLRWLRDGEEPATW
ncbi:phage/plasmid primase, P4 family [Georgenia deserti]|uniref:Phage/plasmid primase, P4 family n=1 Tax=Georgenia deserti TaxID=2093781 RepID=A0ABW4KZX3_9MICO